MAAAVHELSIVLGVVETVKEALVSTPCRRVLRVRMRVGAISGAVESALRFSYDLATAGTILEGSALEVDALPVVIHCAFCDDDAVLPGIRHFRCPRCGAPSADIRQGRELEVESLEIEEME